MSADERRKLRNVLSRFQRRVESLAEANTDVPKLLSQVERALERALEERINRIP